MESTQWLLANIDQGVRFSHVVGKVAVGMRTSTIGREFGGGGGGRSGSLTSQLPVKREQDLLYDSREECWYHH